MPSAAAPACPAADRQTGAAGGRSSTGGRRSGWAAPMGAAVGTAGRRSAGRRPAPAVGRTASHPPAPPAGRAQEIPCRAGPRRDTMPRRPAGAAQRQLSTARAASHPTAPPASRPQEIPNARAREDTTTRRPARNSKRARARYWRRGSCPLRVRKPKIFVGKGLKNRFRGAGAGKVGGVKNATEEENGVVLSKKRSRLCGG